jgi:hypothetical protein
VKTTFKLKINIKRNPLNFKSIQWNHLQAFPIWWDYPFKHVDTCIFFSLVEPPALWEMVIQELFLQYFFIYYYWKFKTWEIYHEVVRNISTNGFRCKSASGFRCKMWY